MAVTIGWTITNDQALKIREALAFHMGFPTTPADVGVPELKAFLAGHVRTLLQKKAEHDLCTANPIVVENPLEE